MHNTQAIVIGGSIAGMLAARVKFSFKTYTQLLSKIGRYTL